MTVVNLSQGYKNSAFKELLLDYHDIYLSTSDKKIINEILKNEATQGTDYNSFFKAAKSASYGSNIRNYGNGINPSSLF